MTSGSPISRLKTLVAEGKLRFVYVIGVARSNSTVVCRVLGERLDGAVYEPHFPNSTSVKRHFAETVLTVYDRVRAGRTGDEPVLLAIKDLSLFLGSDAMDFILAHADHIVFTVRDPLTQHPSLIKQFKTEFSIRQRIDALIRYPVEMCFLAYYLFVLGTGFLVDASRTFGFSLSRLHLLLIAGWNLKSWRNVVRQFTEARARLGTERVTVLDAGLMRLLPDAATASLDAIAAKMRGGRAANPHPVELAGHSRMFPDSAWAGEALASDSIKPLAAGSAPRRPRNAFEEDVLRTFYADYGTLFFDASNALRPLASAERGRPGAEQLAHLLEAESAEAALRRILEGRGTQPAGWQSTTAAAK